MKSYTNLISPRYLTNSFYDYVKDIDEIKDCVYFISDGDFVKIGKTNDIKKRIKTLKTANPRELKIICLINCKNSLESNILESKIHKYFEKKNVSWEWYRIEQIDISKAKQKIGFKLTRTL